MRVRTLVDATPEASPRYLGDVLLLAETWARWGRGDPRVTLDVVVLGTLPAEVRERLDALEIEVVEVDEARLEAPRTANKLAALRVPSDEPVLLVDNDVLFLERLEPLEGRLVRASIADLERVRPEHWRLVEETTRLAPLRVRWTPLAGPPQRPRVERLYLNTGVVWLRDAAAFAATWGDHCARIKQAAGREEDPPKPLVGSDQAGFATAVAATGGFDLLPVAYNFRPSCFARPGEARLLHLSGRPAEPLLGCSEAVRFAWESRVFAGLHAVPGGAPPGSLERAREVRDRLLGLVAESGLDEAGALFAAEPPAA